MTKIRPDSEGNTRLLKSYGGGSTPPRQSYANGYASGGVVKSDEVGPAEAMMASGKSARGSTSKPGRKMAGRGSKKGSTNVNVIIVPKDGDKGAAAMKPPGPDAGPPMAMPMPPPPMPPPGPMAGPGGPGGPPMPMRKSGGRVNRDMGGPVGDILAQGVGGKMMGGDDMSGAGLIGKLGKVGGIGSMMGRKKGGRVHDDAKTDKKMVDAEVHKHEKSMHKGKPMTKLSVGGPAKPPIPLTAGSGSGEGRLDKLKKGRD